ncbi:MAG: PKD domain-containing protein [Thermoproteota archaeon]|nr:PKD domain-containing protein [Thermoproteota archaeon]
MVSPAMTIALTATVVAIAIILLTANIPITNAQQQQQPLTSQPALTQNGTTLFQSIEDGIRLKVPEGWVIHDVNNTGSTLSEESTQGYGILAQLCTEEEEQQQGSSLSNVSGSGDTAICQGPEGDIIHIVRYLDLDTRLQGSNNVTTTNNNNMTIDNILLYHMQKLQEVGYSGIEIVNSTDTTLNVANPQTNETIATVPAKLVEITYSSNFAPNETRTGSFILTATNVTAPNLGTTKGYSVFYEGNSTATAETPIPSGSLAPILLPASVRQVFDSFELVAAAAPSPPSPPPTSPLIVEITSSDTEGEVAPATFEFEAEVAGGTEPYTYSWDFDGEGSGESNEQTVSHTFEEAGSYNVGLTVTDSGGQIGSDSMEITVEEAPEEEEEDNNNSGSDDLIDVDDIIDDLFDRLGIR